MNFKQKLNAVLIALGLKGSDLDNASSEKWAEYTAKYKEMHNSDFYEDMQKAETERADASAKAEAHDQALNIISENTDTETQDNKNLTEQVNGLITQNKEKEKEIQDLKSKVDILSKEIEEDEPIEKIEGKMEINYATQAHSATHLFGVEASMFDLSKPWNKVFTGQRSDINISDDEDLIEEVKSEVKAYGKTVKKFVNHLQKTKQLSAVIRGEKIDYSAFDDFGFGHQYVVQRTTELLHYVYRRKSISKFFPTRYEVQDKEVVVTTTISSLSQAYQAGRVFKGKVSVKPEKMFIKKAMFKHLFDDMEALEREYIGYLNKEGSDPIKWTFIEYILVKMSEILMDEREHRRALGYYIEPKSGVPGHYLNAANGMITAIEGYREAGKIKAFAQGIYDETTMYSYIEDFLEKANEGIPSLNGWKLRLNEKHKKWFLKSKRAALGLHNDFDKNSFDVEGFEEVEFVWLPNMGKSHMMFLAPDGILEFDEDKPGEMFALYFERELESLIVASWWKEGSNGVKVGNGKVMFVIPNAPYSEVEKDATTIDLKSNYYFRTVKNTAEKKLTTLTNMEEGIVYKIECGGDANHTGIDKGGFFSGLTENYAPTAVGDFIKVTGVYDEDGALTGAKEVARKVTA